MSNSKDGQSADKMQHGVHAEPDKVVEPEESMPEFTNEELPRSILNAIENAGWDSLTPVQAKSLPYQLYNRDLMVQAKTGSGKTGAFVLPLLEKLRPDINYTQALILVPTRELARQVEREARTIFEGTGLRVLSVYGGVGYGHQREALEKGAHMVVGTPGRILDLLLRRTFDLDDLETLIFDEADRMLSIGFYPDMCQVKSYLPRHPISTYMFSATFPEHVLRLSKEFMYKPQLLSLSSKQVHVTEIEHAYYEVPSMGKERHLMRILEMENPTSAIIFCNTKANVEFVATVLNNFGFNAADLTSDLSQSRREKVLEQLRNGDVRFLVATDIAARGIDVPDLSHVIMYEPPEDKESYIHRAGRTGRAGSSGIAISLVDVIQKLELQRISAAYSINFEHRQLPDDKQVIETINERLTTILEGRFRGKTILERERISRYKDLVRQIAQDEEQCTLVGMLLDELYQSSLHSRPPQPPTPKPRPNKSRPQKNYRSKSGKGGKPQGSRSGSSGNKRRY
ncbi:DEAD/DEAH box helicase [Maridesulfovibrio hydrothermalis]|uniref:DEAD/DEAH box helicase domain protein n=1 Tax=Maridesulfovibrio hydrothermalis AM13 = DSM 14728 TaxID=1121451 RepID=L0RB11_9BACT|nr:DEAD/DEAH box helicase [Maridesulfovibrio hydrothermalis]CCO23385.1 DEAD/DEAH box helicase domain protein [Maridesulfovibrio hydrothermalis AM13 = DSM 14728]